MQEPKVKEKEEFKKIMVDHEYKKSLGLVTVNDVCKHVGITVRTYYVWQGKPVDSKFDFDAELEKNAPKLVKQILKQVSSQKCSPKTLEIYAKLLGKYVDKREDKLKVEFTPTDYSLIAGRVVQGLRDQYQSGNGICPVCQRPKVLVDAVCVDTEPEHGEESQVADMDVSDLPF